MSGEACNTSQVSQLFKGRFGKTISILETDFESAEMVKYMTNSFLATKVSFMNEMKALCDACDARWEDALEGFLRDGRVGHSHTQVPGPDGKFGFGGSCFPKDIQALINFSKDLNINLNTVEGAWSTNLKVRPEQDWLELKGRAYIGGIIMIFKIKNYHHFLNFLREQQAHPELKEEEIFIKLDKTSKAMSSSCCNTVRMPKKS